uniref:Ternary complex factor MIP1 leucine-zipper domain-containing protein n=1 Tax=Chenopodium quinoa TaxID=63459 RepID=A0A803KSE5_CHEQI
MNTKARTSQQIRKHPLNRQNAQMQGTRSTSGNQKSKEKKLALLQDVDRLKKKLRDEENIHRALQRAFNRPLGALPRLPPYLPPNTQELLAEIAVLEEEVVRLEEQVVTFRHNLYEEAVFICSKRKLESPVDYYERILSRCSSKDEHSDSEISPISVARTASTSSDIVSDRSSLSLARTTSTSSDIVSDQTAQNSSDLVNRKGVVDEPNSTADSLENCKQEENKTLCNSNRNTNIKTRHIRRNSGDLMNGKQGLSNHDFSLELMKKEKGEGDQKCSINFRNIEFSERKLSRVKTPAKKSSFKRQPSQKQQPVNKELGGDSEPNKISEDILKCLCSIYMRMGTNIDKGTQLDTSPLSFVSRPTKKDLEFQDPYGASAEIKARDIGAYKNFCLIDAISFDLKRKRNALFLLHKLKLLLGKLARVSLDGLSHQHKLAFWINTYNACLMNAFLEHGIPESPEKVVLLMREGARKSAKGDDLKASEMFGLECVEPLVTFALSCGSWSSPVVRVYTASQIESELEVAKREYLQAAVGVSKNDKLLIPKLLDWYQLDFAKNLDSLVDWVCLQLPDELRKEAFSCLERKGKINLSDLVEVVPYDFSFRYIIHP